MLDTAMSIDKGQSAAARRFHTFQGKLEGNGSLP